MFERWCVPRYCSEKPIIMRFYYLDFLRLFLAFCVVQYHVFEQLHKGTAKIMQGAFLAVDCFFILSGFVLTQSIVLKNLTFNQFLVQRIARIFPLFWLSLALVVVASEIDITNNNNIYDFITQFFLLHSLGFITQHLGWNYPSWTLSVEFWLNIGMLYFMVRYIESKREKSGIFMAMLLVLCFASIFFIRAGNGNFDIYLNQIFGFTNIGVIRCLIGFSIGVLLYYASKSEFLVKNFSKSKSYIFLCEIILLFLLYCCLKRNGLSYNFLCVFIVFPLIVLISAVRTNVSLFSQICSLPIIRELGNFSYAVYLLHVPFLYFLATFSWFTTKEPYFQSIVLCVATFAVSVPVYYFYEKKAKKILIEKLS